MKMVKKKLPIGIQTFSTIRENNAYYYVDKTQKIIEMINQSNYIFLSRPRRFGKSLTLDTIAELFLANKSLFTGLYAEQNWDWDRQYPVIRISFGFGMADENADFPTLMSDLFNLLEQQWKLEHQQQTITGRFKSLIEHCYHTTGQKVVILIDEYDKPILDNLSNPEKAILVRNQMRDFYSVIKDSDKYIRFAMLTGVSKFSKINLFSGLNNLLDITLEENYSDLCGYTQAELENTFADELEGVDLKELKYWYNGYNWTGESVYNPFDILLFLNSNKKTFKPYWIETGNATFLIDKLINEQVDITQIRHGITDSQVLSSFEVGDISAIALLFQTGYLTIDKVKTNVGGEIYTLKFPNMEVQQSLNSSLLNGYLGRKINTLMVRSELYEALINHQPNQVMQYVQAFFASIPHDWHRNNKIAHYEGYWASVFYALFASLGFTTITEDSTSRGNVDMTLIIENHIYIFEFKVIHNEHHEPSGIALNQIQAKNYADKYRIDGNIIHQIGVEFHEHSREVMFDIVQ